MVVLKSVQISPANDNASGPPNYAFQIKSRKSSHAEQYACFEVPCRRYLHALMLCCLSTAFLPSHQPRKREARHNAECGVGFSALELAN